MTGSIIFIYAIYVIKIESRLAKNHLKNLTESFVKIL